MDHDKTELQTHSVLFQPTAELQSTTSYGTAQKLHRDEMMMIPEISTRGAEGMKKIIEKTKNSLL
jgi:hypothetical protein